MRKTFLICLMLLSGCTAYQRSVMSHGDSVKAAYPTLPIRTVYVTPETVYPNDIDADTTMYCSCAPKRGVCDCFDTFTWWNVIDPHTCNQDILIMP